MRISDWSSDVCSSDLGASVPSKSRNSAAPVSSRGGGGGRWGTGERRESDTRASWRVARIVQAPLNPVRDFCGASPPFLRPGRRPGDAVERAEGLHDGGDQIRAILGGFMGAGGQPGVLRSEEHTSELQSLMRTSYAVFCLKK